MSGSNEIQYYALSLSFKPTTCTGIKMLY